MGKKRIYSDETLIEELRRVAALVGGRVLSQAQFSKHSPIDPGNLCRRLGGWHKALERAGLGDMRASVTFSDEEIVEEMRRVAGLLNGRRFSSSDFQRHSRMNQSGVCNRFGSWGKALERAGLGHMRRAYSHPSDEEMIEEMRRVAGLLEGPTFSSFDLQKHSKMSRTGVCNRFGSWRQALEGAGLGHMCVPGSGTGIPRRERSPDEPSNQEILEEIRRVAALFGRPISAIDFERHSRMSKDIVRARFKTWPKAVKRADDGRARHWKDKSM